MPQCIPGRMARQWGVYRQRVAEAPALLAWETLSRSNVTQVVHEAPGKGRERCLPPSGTLWTVLLQVWSLDGSCRDAVTRVWAFQVAPGEQPCAPNTGSDGTARGRLPAGVGARLAQAASARLSPEGPVRWRWTGRRVQRVDGSTVSLPDPPATQAESPQHPLPQRGLGCPIARMLGGFGRARGRL